MTFLECITLTGSRKRWLSVRTPLRFRKNSRFCIILCISYMFFIVPSRRYSLQLWILHGFFIFGSIAGNHSCCNDGRINCELDVYRSKSFLTINSYYIERLKREKQQKCDTGSSMTFLELLTSGFFNQNFYCEGHGLIKKTFSNKGQKST